MNVTFKLIEGDKVVYRNGCWSSAKLTEKNPGTITRRWYSDGTPCYDLEFLVSGSKHTDSRVETDLVLVGESTIYEARLTCLGAGVLTHLFRAKNMSKAEEVMAGLLKGNKGNQDKTLMEMMGNPKMSTDNVIIVSLKEYNR